MLQTIGTTMRGKKLPFWTTMALLLTACSGGSSSGPQVNVTGDWAGSWTSATPQPDGTFLFGSIEGSYIQTGAQVTGTTVIREQNCFAVVDDDFITVMHSTGALDGEMINGDVSNPLSAIDLVAYTLEVVTSTQITGSYTVTSSSHPQLCGNSRGTFVLTKL